MQHSNPDGDLDTEGLATVHSSTHAPAAGGEVVSSHVVRGGRPSQASLLVVLRKHGKQAKHVVDVFEYAGTDGAVTEPGEHGQLAFRATRELEDTGAGADSDAGPGWVAAACVQGRMLVALWSTGLLVGYDMDEASRTRAFRTYPATSANGGGHAAGLLCVRGTTRARTRTRVRVVVPPPPAVARRGGGARTIRVKS